ncbi:hypothetical protein [Paenibacillus radicis (ex Gao et al. 2016)]|uniref:Uncharacterized protein n=1 Tax=Paenibacillus radicis (ex Gao et al. 2016) TaxID=1737354 RepID=A0A917M9H8_9BACL|nr:hypothetical protein [Paenibacillus radicis (ex Gao et al. 2016)]GGG86323.1 hypothetical protein GCM10010918_50630 [Paenibacillus radicis (ex Gao et al. 2016)]
MHATAIAANSSVDIYMDSVSLSLGTEANVFNNGGFDEYTGTNSAADGWAKFDASAGLAAYASVENPSTGGRSQRLAVNGMAP